MSFVTMVRSIQVLMCVLFGLSVDGLIRAVRAKRRLWLWITFVLVTLMLVLTYVFDILSIHF